MTGGAARPACTGASRSAPRRAAERRGTLRVALFLQRRDDRLVEYEVCRRRGDPRDELGDGLRRQGVGVTARWAFLTSLLGGPRTPLGRHCARIHEARANPMGPDLGAERLREPV